MLNKNALTKMGFIFDGTSTHNARTIMLNELENLLQFINRPNASKEDYIHAIVEDNCLCKPSGVTRKKSAQHLVNLYALNPNTAIFKALLYFRQRETQSHQLLALLCSYCRDYVLRILIPQILQIPQGFVIQNQVMEEYLEKNRPGSFSQATLKSTVQNVMASLTKSGHLEGRLNKKRTRATATPGSVSYALYLGYLSGERGQSLFKTEYTALLDCSFDRMIDLTEAASRSGWMVFKHIENVFEIQFPAKELL